VGDLINKVKFDILIHFEK